MTRNRWASLVLIMGMTYLYVDGRRLVIWLKDKIKSWREGTTVNDVNNLKSVNPSLLLCTFWVCLKTVSQIVPATDLKKV